jgi:glutaminyl-peptide cyclotransferase
MVVSLVASGCAATPRATPARPAQVMARVVARLPHATDAFTQGLALHNGRLYESTGLLGHSSLRVVDVATGAVLRRVSVPAEHYAEGLTVLDGRVYQLTYQTHRCFVYDAETLALVAMHGYPGEGWGLTHDGRSLILSDGTDTLRVIDPESFAELRRVRVTDGGAAVDQINELEMVEGELLANVWRSDRIARIDPRSGRVLGWIALPFSRASLGLDEPEAVLNGIAYEPATRRIFVTGKLWPAMFEISLAR